MRRRDRLTDMAGADDYTPATDLVFSMFAMTVLLMAIIGASSQVKTTSLMQRANHCELNRPKAPIGAPVVEPIRCPTPAPASPPPATPSADLSRLQAENAELKARIKAIEDQPPPVPVAPAPAAVAASDLSKLESENKGLKRQLDTALELQGPAQIELPTLVWKTDGPFVTAGAFSPSILRVILSRLKDEKSEIERRRANEIMFELSTGIDPGASSSGSFGVAETVAWGNALLTALSTTPLPIGCVVIEPLGFVRAGGIVKRTIAVGSGPTLPAILGGADIINPAMADKLRSRLAGDRRIRVFLRHVSSSPCQSDALVDAISRLSP